MLQHNYHTKLTVTHTLTKAQPAAADGDYRVGVVYMTRHYGRIYPADSILQLRQTWVLLIVYERMIGILVIIFK